MFENVLQYNIVLTYNGSFVKQEVRIYENYTTKHELFE